MSSDDVRDTSIDEQTQVVWSWACWDSTFARIGHGTAASKAEAWACSDDFRQERSDVKLCAVGILDNESQEGLVRLDNGEWSSWASENARPYVQALAMVQRVTEAAVEAAQVFFEARAKTSRRFGGAAEGWVVVYQRNGGGAGSSGSSSGSGGGGGGRPRPKPAPPPPPLEPIPRPLPPPPPLEPIPPPPKR